MSGPVGATVGVVGLAVGASVPSDGLVDGDALGAGDGDSLGDADGTSVGCDGLADGDAVGAALSSHRSPVHVPAQSHACGPMPPFAPIVHVPPFWHGGMHCGRQSASTSRMSGGHAQSLELGRHAPPW